MDQPAPVQHPDYLSFSDVGARLRGSLPFIAGLAVLGLAVGIGCAVFLKSRQLPDSSIVVELPGLRAEGPSYPDGSPFRIEDLRSPAIVQAAAQRAGLDPAVGSRLEIVGVIPTGVAKERDRARAAGQSVPPFLPTEYRITFRPVSATDPDPAQARRFLTEIAAGVAGPYEESRARLPAELGRIFDTLKDHLYIEYGAVIGEEMRALEAQLQARAPRTGATAKREIGEFVAVLLPYTALQLKESGVSKDPRLALKYNRMQLALLEQTERDLRLEDETLGEVLDRYRVAPGSGSSNQGLDSLASRAVSVRLYLKRQANDKARLLAGITYLEGQEAAGGPQPVPPVVTELETAYQAIVGKVRQALARQVTLDPSQAFRITQAATTESPSPPIAYAGGLGLILGLLLGLGLSLLDFLPGRRNA